MLKKLFSLLLLFTSIINAQYSIKGKMEPANKYTWIILYQLQGAKQNYISNTNIVNGEFNLTMPEKAKTGIYRLVYDMKNRIFIDFIFDNENVTLNFNPKNPNQSAEFKDSESNQLFYSYLKYSSKQQQKLDSLQVRYFNTTNKLEQENIIRSYQKHYTILITLQAKFEKAANNMLVYHFIKASARINNNSPFKNPDEYLTFLKNHYFDNIDFNNDALLKSTFINDKINDFIFYLNTSDDNKIIDQLQKEAISAVINKLSSNKTLAKDIEEGLIYTFSKQENIIMVNYMLNHYLQLPKELQDAPFINDIKGQLKTAIGMLAPNIFWTENKIKKDLISLTDASYYVVVFWSSTCPHCLMEMPLLYNFLKDNRQIKVISIGLEDNTSKAGWETQIANYPNFINVYGENKWKNSFARNYGVNATPSFFILDPDKKIIAKPDDVDELVTFFPKI